MNPKRIDLRYSFRAMPNVATGSREPAFTAFMKSILVKERVAMRVFCTPEGKWFAFPMPPSRLFAGPAGANLVAPARCDRVIG